MNENLVAKLRQWEHYAETAGDADLLTEAADEIERLSALPVLLQLDMSRELPRVSLTDPAAKAITSAVPDVPFSLTALVRFPDGHEEEITAENASWKRVSP